MIKRSLFHLLYSEVQKSTSKFTQLAAGVGFTVMVSSRKTVWERCTGFHSFPHLAAVYSDLSFWVQTWAQYVEARIRWQRLHPDVEILNSRVLKKGSKVQCSSWLNVHVHQKEEWQGWWWQKKKRLAVATCTFSGWQAEKLMGPGLYLFIQDWKTCL